MRLSLPVLPLVLGALVATAGHASALAANDPAATPIHLDDASLPDPARSPGDFSRDLVAADLCDTPIEEFATAPPNALCEEAFEEARVSADYRFQYACVFLVPPSIGGTQSRANIWLQPAAEAPLKATADVAARKQICRSPGDLAEAQRLLAINWVGAYRRYLLPGDKLAPIAKEERGPDTFGLLPPAPAEEGGASGNASFGGAYGDEPGYGYGDGDGGGNGGGANSDDRRRQRRSLGDGRRGADGRGADGRGAGRRRDDAGRAGDHRADDRSGPRANDRDGRRQNEAGRDDAGRDRIVPHPDMPHGGMRAEDGRREDGRHRDWADRDRDGGPPHGGGPDDKRGWHSHDWAHDHRDGRAFDPSGGDRDPYHRPPAIDAHGPSNGERGVGWPNEPSAFPPGNPNDRNFDTNHRPDQDRRLAPRYARGQGMRSYDIRPNRIRPNDVRPTSVPPNDIRPSRPGLGRPRYPSGPHRFGGRGRGRRR